MDFEELRNTLAKERESKLAKLDPDFYESVRAYLDELRMERKTASEREAQFLADELDTAGNRLQHIFKRRVGKIVNLASLNIMAEIEGTRNEINAMTPTERSIYDSVLSAVRKGWHEIDEVLTGESAQTMAQPIIEDIQSDERNAEGIDGKAVMEERVEDVLPANHESRDKLADYTVVRVLKDVTTFMGADSHHYTLAKNDVVMLPNINANVLCKRRVVLPVTIKQMKG